MLTSSSSQRLPPTSIGALWLAGGVLVLATVAAYQGTFSVPFIFDDQSAIIANPSIRHLGLPWTVLSPPPLLTVSGRPFLNFTLALNYAVSGTAPWSYHALNLAIHMAAGLALFGAIRRTLLLPALAPRFGRDALTLAMTGAALWLLHPLQTESVTYVVQRAESLMGLFYLLTLYAFVRAIDCHLLADKRVQRSQVAWLALSVGACLLGMGTKEVIATAPLVVLAYDRTLVAGGWRAAWQERRWFYAALASTWLLLGWLVFGTEGRGGTAGFNTDVTAMSYVLTQVRAIVIYLKLALWPHPLVFDYGGSMVNQAGDVLAAGACVLTLVAGTAVALWRKTALGFFGLWFFLILAPSSSVMPIATQTMAEHRMYLPLAAVVVAAVAVAYAQLGRIALVGGLGAALAGGVLTWQRNQTYRNELALWEDTVAKSPLNSRAHYNLAVALAQTNQKTEAVAHYERALRLDPTYAEACNNLGVVLLQLGRTREAIFHFEQTLREKPDYPEAHSNLGLALLQSGRLTEAASHYAAVLRVAPNDVTAHNNLGYLALQQGRPDQAVTHYLAVAQLRPNEAEAHYNLGVAYARAERWREAVAALEAALKLKPDHLEAQRQLARLRTLLGR